MTTVLHGDCLEVMASLAMLGVRVDSVVTDPPYHLTTAGRFGAEGAAPAGYGTDGLYQRASRGFMGKEWDGGDEIGRAHVCTPVTNAHLVCRLLLEQKNRNRHK